jgi:hypothetical protein
VHEQDARDVSRRRARRLADDAHDEPFGPGDAEAGADRLRALRERMIQRPEIAHELQRGAERRRNARECSVFAHLL